MCVNSIGQCITQGIGYVGFDPYKNELQYGYSSHLRTCNFNFHYALQVFIRTTRICTSQHALVQSPMSDIINYLLLSSDERAAAKGGVRFTRASVDCSKTVFHADLTARIPITGSSRSEIADSSPAVSIWVRRNVFNVKLAERKILVKRHDI